MAGTVLEGMPPIKIGGEWRPDGKGPHTDVEVRVAYSLFHAEANAFFLEGVTLTQMSTFKRKDGWLLLLKGTKGHRNLKAWMHAPTWRGALVMAATSLDCQHVRWQEDTPPAKG